MLLLLLLPLIPVRGQNKEVMGMYQAQLQQLFAEVFHAPTESQRQRANEEALVVLQDALNQENSFRWQWDFGSLVSVLTSPDKRFRIFTWPLANDAFEYECFGVMQVLNDKTDHYDIHLLHDRSQQIVNRQEETLSPDNWYGAVYQNIVTTTYNGKTYYTLLGWTVIDMLSQRKVIEPLTFKGSSCQPQFGQNLFRGNRNIRRIVLEYSSNAMVNLRYEEQYVRTVERVRAKRSVKNNRRARKSLKKAERTSAAQRERVVSGPTVKTTDTKLMMIIYDAVGPQVMGMEGLFQYYVPTGEELALEFVDGKWISRNGAQGRVNNKKLNQDFDKPHVKEAPAYMMNKEK